jgi:hypothetical protein
VVDTKLAWRPTVVEIRVGVERKSDVRYPRVIPPVVEINSGTSMTPAVVETKRLWSPAVVEMRESVER